MITPTLQDLIAAAPAGGFVQLPPGDYPISAPVVIDRPLTLSGYGARLIQQRPGAGGLRITSGGVRVLGLELAGPQGDSVIYVDGERAIETVGPSAAAPLAGVELTDCRMSVWGGYGLFARFVTGLTLTGCRMSGIGYTGAMVLSCSDVLIRGCRASGPMPGAQGNSYGIALSRVTNEPSGLVANPRCSRARVEGCHIEGVPWEGIDTHAGSDVTIANNEVRGCGRGISVGPGKDASGNITYGPQKVTIVGNLVDSGRADGSADVGISVVGAAGERADGCIIAGNVIRGHGTQGVTTSGAIVCYYAQSLAVRGNHVWRGSPYGVQLYHDNFGFAVFANTIIDPWTTDGPEADAIRSAGVSNIGTVASNMLLRGSLSAPPHVLRFGMRVDDAIGTRITWQGNYCDAPAYYDPGKRVIAV